MPAVLFDFDYTLADSSPGIIDAFNHGLAAASLPPASESAIRSAIGLPVPKMVGQITGIEDPTVAEVIFEAFMARADETMEPLTTVFAATRPALETLRGAGYSTGIVSTKFRRRIEAVLARRGLMHLIDLVIGLEDVEAPKPDPAGLRLAMERLGIEARETVYVGDHAVDARAAEAAGVRFIGVLTGAGGAESFGGLPVLAVVRDVGDVPAVVADPNARDGTYALSTARKAERTQERLSKSSP